MKARRLFADEEPNVLDGLRRMTRSMRSEWKIRFAPNGREALALLQTHPCDVVISDMRMSGMDGKRRTMPGDLAKTKEKLVTELETPPDE